VQLKPIAALSAGLVNGQRMVDLTQQEDNAAHADVTFVVTQDGAIVEMQGTGEKAPLAWSEIVALKEMVDAGLPALFEL